jgi:transcriptional regulator with XRE-family HTH domain|tara:strand:+ start:420 stop:803 length:384 start_codon:yes stop_codon:yes gene_type:complete
MAKAQVEKEVVVNQHIGKRIRKRRIELGITQTDLGNHLPTSFQQIQKYEKGTNGVSSAKLIYLAHALQVPITYFFEGFDIIKGVSNFTYKDNPPELHRGNQIKNAKYYPDPQAVDDQVIIEKLQKII